MISLDSYRSESLCFHGLTENIILADGQFMRVSYVMPEEDVRLTGIYIQLLIPGQMHPDVSTIYLVNPEGDGVQMMDRLYQLERVILERCPFAQEEEKKWMPVYRLQEQLSKGYLRYYVDEKDSGSSNNNSSHNHNHSHSSMKLNSVLKSNMKFMLIIAGIWTNAYNQYGITYKFVALDE